MLSIKITNEDEMSAMKYLQSPAREKITSFQLGNIY